MEIYFNYGISVHDQIRFSATNIFHHQLFLLPIIAHILACYVRHYDNDKDGKSVAEWSLYHNGNEQPLLEQTCLTEDFHNMLDSYGWEEEEHEVVVAR